MNMPGVFDRRFLLAATLVAVAALSCTDAEREYAYDRNSPIGKLDKALDEATAKGWTVVDIKNDWKVIYPLEK
jgi:hypothetical protein